MPFRIPGATNPSLARRTPLAHDRCGQRFDSRVARVWRRERRARRERGDDTPSLVVHVSAIEHERAPSHERSPEVRVTPHLSLVAQRFGDGGNPIGMLTHRRTSSLLAAWFSITILPLAAQADPPDCSPGVTCHAGNNCDYATINGLCGGSAEINGVRYSFGALCQKVISPPIRLLGSPSGLAYRDGGGLRIKLFKANGDRLDAGREVWLQVAEGTKPDLLDGGPTRLECNNGHGAVVHYLEGFEAADTTADVLYPAFGGTGSIDVAIEICCPPFYCPVMAGAFDGISTDIDDDGDTDEADEAILRSSMAGTFDARCDLNGDGVVDEADLDILMLEARRRVRGTGCELDLGTFTQFRPAPITSLTARRTGPNTIGLQWIATGDDSLTGVAFQYDIRASSSPIDEENFAAAPPLAIATSPTGPASGASAIVQASVPAPTTSGTMQSFAATIDGSACYVAMKVMDDAGNWSALSNLAEVCETTSVPDEDRTGLDFRVASVNAGEATLRFVYECPPSLAGSPLELVVLDAAGRRLASSGLLAAGAGRHELPLRAAGALRAGVYFARLRVGQRAMTRTLSVTP